MPLLNKKPFVKREPPSHLQLSDKVFYCDITNEVFTDFDEYWERLVLCNAMVWTCELTGRPSLTYTEAAESETRARRCLSNVPQVLRKPLLYIATLTRRGRYIDMSEDVFTFVRDRYFVGEEVEAIVKNHWYDCRVIQIIYPTPEEIAKYEFEMAESDEEGSQMMSEAALNGGITAREMNGEMGSVDDDDIQIIKDLAPKKKEVKKLEEGDDYPPFATYKYEVIEIEPWDYKEVKKHTVTWEQIRRVKGTFTREKCKLLLKQCVELSPSGFWVIKENLSRRYDLDNVVYSDIFLGEPPKFRETKAKKMPVSLNPDKEMKKLAAEKRKRERKEAREKNPEVEVKRRGRIPMSEEEKEARKKMLKEEKDGLKLEKKEKQREELKQKLEKDKVEKKIQRELRKEQKRLHQQYMKEWNRVRDDLDCDDHKDLPKPTPVQCRIPDDLFSDFIMVLEFINIFSDLVELKDVYPQGITFDILEHALVEKEVAGVFNDLMQLLLQTIFTLQEEEDDEVEADNTADEVMEANTSDITIHEAVRVANRASTWSQQYHGLPLQKVPLDALTVTEILRLHLLASGATSVANGQWRHFNRGGFKNWDDPGLHFKLHEPMIIKSLATQTIFDLPLVYKLKILSVLVAQILTYASVRDIIDDNIEKLREVKNKLRLHQLAQIKKEKEINSARLQEKRERKQKERDRLLREAEKKAAAAAMTGEADNPIELDEDEEEDDDEEEEDESEKAAREEKEEKNKEARKQDFLKRERELMQQVLNMAQGVNCTPLGQDRAYRRYWLFSSLPGLFVEDNELNPGVCRDTPTPYNPQSAAELTEALEKRSLVEAKKNLAEITTEKDDKNNSDKENDGSQKLAKPLTVIPNKKLLKMPNNNQSSGQIKTEKNLVNLSSPANDAKSDLKMNGNVPKMMNCEVKLEVMPNHSESTICVKSEKSLPILPSSTNSTESELKMDALTPKINCEVKLEVMTNHNELVSPSVTNGMDSILNTALNAPVMVNGDNECEGVSVREESVTYGVNSPGPAPDIFGLCTADPQSCPVHANRNNKHKWFFFHKIEDLNSLISSLNSRGYREGELKNVLECYKTAAENSMKACPVFKLDPSQEPEIDQAVRKSQRNLNTKKDEDANLNFPPGTSIDEILQYTLRDMILETEEKIHMGMLGSLRIGDREAWREAIVEGILGKGSELDFFGRKRIYTRLSDLDFGGRKRISQFKMELGVEISEEQDGEELLGEATEAAIVKDLAQAILQLGQSIECKYLKPPLGETDKARRVRERAEEKYRRKVKKNEDGGAKSDRDSDDDEDSSRVSDQVMDNALRTPIERWEMSLMASTSLSQLCLHFATLDNSITWSRSALNARCRICKRKADAENMLLCDGCDKGHHIYCLKPKLKEIPSGDWFCDRCKKKEKPKSPRKNRQIYKDVSDDEMGFADVTVDDENSEVENQDSCFVCEKPGRLICCDTCPLAFHQACANLRKIPQGNWSCHHCHSNPPIKGKLDY
ncbi:bromodomain adjacent to zinc finger domain protein 1A [Cherax quadricarinatus]|uniref:bromodomain adjacent to zinc finger domain protein 1A n=1 Tax=Cherax quadricarinatus TaxID=27406 RepID=UPI00387EE189